MLLTLANALFPFEFFPPKTDQGVESLFRSLDELTVYRPDYVSVTYGAGGSTRDKTVDMVARMKNETDLEVVSHITCVSQRKDDVQDVLARLDEVGVENVLALRGDPPRGEEKFVPVDGDFVTLPSLIAHIRDSFDFGVGAACFPEKHLDSPDLDSDMHYLKHKVDMGVDFLVTQLFFDNADFFGFKERMEQWGIQVPVIVGVLPILSTSQIRRFAALCGAKIPPKLDAQLERFADDDDAVREIGVDHATMQVEKLWENGVPGIHFYTLNRSYSVSKILDNLSLPADQTVR